ncbi:MAG: thermonuclease family protein [Clostridia bacterium]
MKKISKKYIKVIFVSISSIAIVIFLALGVLDAKDSKKLLSKLNNISVNEDLNKTTSDKKDDDLITQIDTTKFEKAYVKRVVDGDTIIATIDNTDYKVRFIGINTPESTTKIEPYGKEASAFTKAQLLGKTVYLQKDVSSTDKYGRLLRYIWLEIPTSINEGEIKTKMYNAKLLTQGYAQVATYPPDVLYTNYFVKMGREARENNIGLWK